MDSQGKGKRKASEVDAMEQGRREPGDSGRRSLRRIEVQPGASSGYPPALEMARDAASQALLRGQDTSLSDNARGLYGQESQVGSQWQEEGQARSADSP